MIITIDRPLRPYVDLSDLTTKQITSRGWEIDSNGDEHYVIQFAVNLSATEEAAIRRRLATNGTVQETLFERGEAAVGTDQNFRDVITPQLLTGANNIINDPTITQAEAIQYVRDLATAVRSLTNQVDSLTRQNIGLIRLTQNLFDSAD